MPSSVAIWRRIGPTRGEQRAAGALRRPAARARSRSRARAGRARGRRARRRAGRAARPGGGAAAPAASAARGLLGAASAALRSDQPTAKNAPPMSRNGSFGSAGTSAKAQITPPATSGALRWSRIWPPMSLPRSFSEAERVTRMPVATEISSAGICAHEAVADGQQRELVRGLAERHPLLHDADDDAADEVDQRDQDAGHRVALDELRGAVHRAVEVGLAGDLLAAPARLLVGDLARVEVGVDRHLLAGHGVEREARADLGHAAGAVRDDHELDDDEDQEDDEADDDVAADDELAERRDDVAGVAVQQDQARDGDVDRQPEQRREQQQASGRRRSRARAAGRASR